MSRAFVNEDAGGAEREYRLPARNSPYYPEASAWALLEGANEGDSRGAEQATGYRWGDARLVPHMRRILEQAREQGEDRTAQLARRFLRVAESGG